MAKEGLKAKRKLRSVRRLGFLLAVLIFLSGCGSFADNPVVQSLQKGDPFVDLTRDHLDTLFDEYSTGATSSQEEEGSANNQDRALLDSFVTRVQRADALEYQRLISYSGEQPTPTDDVDNLLLAPILQITEEKEKVMATDMEEERRILVNEAGWHYFNIKPPSTEEEETGPGAAAEEPVANPDAKEFEVPDNHRLTDILLGQLCRDANLTLLSAETQQVGETTYIAYNVKENDNLAKWFFDDHGNLFLRIYQDGDIPVAVRYDFLDLKPTIQSQFFTMEGAQTLPSVGDKNKGEENEPAEGKEPELKDPEEEIAPIKEEAVATEEKKEPPATKDPTTPATTAPAPPPATAPLPVTPPAVVPSTPAPAADPKKETPKEVKPQTVPDFSGGKMADPPKEEPKEDPDLTIKLPKNYPVDQFPIYPGFYLESATDTIDALQRDIYVMGKVDGNLDSVSTYYDRLLILAYPADIKEMYDEDNSETLILYTGRKDGWAYTVEITESHFTGRCTISIRLRR